MENKLNKKAQGMSVTTIILIALGLVVLVILILGFTMGWANLKGFIIPSNNVERISQQCSVACNTDQEYTFCSETKTLKADDLPGDVNSVDNTCNYFATNLAYKKYGIDGCSGLCPTTPAPPATP